MTSKQKVVSIPDGFIFDYLSSNIIADSKKEKVRQRIIRALIHEYGFSPEDMENDFGIGSKKKIDIAIFHHSKSHEVENISRAVLCRPEPNVGKNVFRIRDFEQASKDLEDIETIMRDVASIQYGLWTNGLDFFFLEKEQKRLETK